MNSDLEKQRLLNKRQVAEYLGVSLRTIERYTQTANFPTLKIGGLNRYRIEDVDRWVDGGRFSADGQEPAGI